MLIFYRTFDRLNVTPPIINQPSEYQRYRSGGTPGIIQDGIESGIIVNFTMCISDLAGILFYCKQTQFLTRTMACGSFNMEDRRFCYCLSRRGIFLTRVMCFNKVDNSVTNGKFKSNCKQVNLWYVYILQNSNSFYFDFCTCKNSLFHISITG